MLNVELQSDYASVLAAMPDRVRQALSAKANALAAALVAKVQQQLTGGVLNAKSGALGCSIVATIEESATVIAVRVGTSGDIKYAAIHEFGGTVPPHDIVPDKARVLAFVTGGKQVFAARVGLPAIVMPERSYLRSSLAEVADEITNKFREAVIGEIR